MDPAINYQTRPQAANLTPVDFGEDLGSSIRDFRQRAGTRGATRAEISPVTARELASLAHDDSMNCLRGLTTLTQIQSQGAQRDPGMYLGN